MIDNFSLSVDKINLQWEDFDYSIKNNKTNQYSGEIVGKFCFQMPPISINFDGKVVSFKPDGIWNIKAKKEKYRNHWKLELYQKDLDQYDNFSDELKRDIHMFIGNEIKFRIFQCLGEK